MAKTLLTSIVLFLIYTPSFTQSKGAKKSPLLPTDISFLDKTFDFGKAKEGEKVVHKYKFFNSGSENLHIENVIGSCTCIVTDWPKELIKPGDKGIISVTFDTKGKGKQNGGAQSKRATVIANTNPKKSFLTIRGKVFSDLHKESTSNKENLKETLKILENKIVDNRDNQTYKVIKYDQGSRIGPISIMIEDLKHMQAGAFEYDHQEKMNMAQYGFLYKKDGIKNACPDEWRLPTNEEFITIINLFGGEKEAASALKAKYHWKTNWDSPATNKSKFSAYPSGSIILGGRYMAWGLGAYWWTSSKNSQGEYIIRGINHNSNVIGTFSSGKIEGAACRCVKN